MIKQDFVIELPFFLKICLGKRECSYIQINTVFWDQKEGKSVSFFSAFYALGEETCRKESTG